jgi:iron(III) transport system substrate-binding protein
MKNIPLILVIILIIVLPFLFQKETQTVTASDDTLIVITPHDEGIRHEFETAFAEYYKNETGRTVDVDWRVIGGTSEIIRYVQSTYTNNFRNYWENKLGRKWSPDIQNSFMNRKLDLDDSPEDDTANEEAKRLFTQSDVTCGIDVFFGGGSYDFIQQGRSGTLVPFANPSELTILFPPDVLPISYSGEPFYDKNALWVGAVLSQFGIIYNKLSLQRLGIDTIPNQWEDLTDPRYIGELAISDPTQSGSSTKAFEMIVQQQMLRLVTEASGDKPENADVEIVAEGWMKSMKIIQLICANARYFTDSSKKPSLDVSAGECAAGMSIDFYGRYQAETIFNRTGSERFGYVTPYGGSTVSVDPIAIFRGAPHKEIANIFVRFVMSEKGQKLWNWKPGTPEGTQKYALRRSPMLRYLYDPKFDDYRSDAGNDPYDETGSFVYHPAWTGSLFSPLRFIIKTAFIDPHEEMASAWAAIQEAEKEGRTTDAQEARCIFTDLSSVDYFTAGDQISNILNQRTKISEVQLARKMTLHFRDQYIRAKRAATGSD